MTGAFRRMRKSKGKGKARANGDIIIASSTGQKPSSPIINKTPMEGDEGITFDHAVQRLQRLIDKPESFIAPPPELAQSLTRVLKTLFDYARSTQPLKLGPLQELLIEGFDTETVWEQLQLRNPAVQKFVSKVTKRLIEKGEDLQAIEGYDEDDEGEEEEDDDDEEDKDDVDEEKDDVDEEDERQERLVGESDDEDEEEGEDEEEEEEEEDNYPPQLIKGKNTSKSRKPLDDDDGDVEKEEEQEGRQNGGGKKRDFFDWDEMERFANEAEEEEFGDDDEEEEEEEEEDDDDEEGNGDKEIRYEEFFGKEDDEEEEGDGGRGLWDDDEEEEGQQEQGEGGRRRRGLLDGDEEEEDQMEEDETGLTTYQREQRAKRKEIEALEEELISERPWELKGEARGTDRPENSLLEAEVDVERATRPTLMMTAEKSLSIEEMIKKRIMEENWDDVVPKDVGDEIMMNRRKKDDLPEVSQEKSKEGLGDIYEKEYIRLAMGVEGESQESKDKLEMAALFRKLCTKLDALSNFHFTPKPTKIDLTVKPNVAAIAMEEVLPLAVSQAETHAPEEVHEKKKGREGVLRDEAELEQEDRQRLRRSKKTARRKARRQVEVAEKLVARINPGLGNKYSKEKMRQEIRISGKVVKGKVEAGKTSYTTSSKFFSALQDEVRQNEGGYAKKKKRTAGEGQEKEKTQAAALKL